MLNPVSLGWSFASTRSQFIPQETAELSTGKMVQETQGGPPRAPWGAQRVQRRAQQPPTRCQVGKCTTCLKQKLSFFFISTPPTSLQVYTKDQSGELRVLSQREAKLP